MYDWAFKLQVAAAPNKDWNSLMQSPFYISMDLHGRQEKNACAGSTAPISTPLSNVHGRWTHPYHYPPASKWEGNPLLPWPSNNAPQDCQLRNTGTQTLLQYILHLDVILQMNEHKLLAH